MCFTALMCYFIQATANKRIHQAYIQLEYDLYYKNKGTPSPYKISKLFNRDDQRWGYVIVDKNSNDPYTSNNTYVFFYTIESAIQELNIIEKLGGYCLTTFDLVE